jgi:hypothetical protein
MARLFVTFPFLLKLYADGGYQGRAFQKALKKSLVRVNLEITKRSDQVKGFVVLQNVGSESEPSPGSADAAGLPRAGSTSSQCARVPAPRLHPAHGAKSIQSHIILPDRLLELAARAILPM